jgi:diketogulonate reductase-like aldo/keto reductase
LPASAVKGANVGSKLQFMEQRVFGPTNRKVAVVGQGTWHFEQGNRSTAVAALRRGLDVGMTHIDSAELYGNGEVEEIVAEAIHGRRDEVFLVSKVAPQNASWAGTLAACERSLARLKTDRLDCYLLHWRGAHPLEETIGAFNELMVAGKIVAWGVSNFDENDLAEAERIAGPNQIACNQVLYHLRDRSIEQAVLPWCEKNNVAVVGYTPFGRGGLPGARSDGGRALAEVAAAHDVTPRQVVLAFLVRQKSMFAIPKAADPGHVAENAGAGELHLTQSDIARIDAAFPVGR